MTSIFAAAGHGLRVGLRAGRENLLPGLLIQGAMLALVVGYYRDWPTTALLDALAALKAKWGHLFAFVATGLCAGVLGEACRVLFLQRGRMTGANAEEMVLRFFLFGICGLGADLNYAFLGALFGTRPTPGVIAAKVAFDQFVYSLFLPCPFMALTYRWKRSGYRAAAWGAIFTRAFAKEEWLPVAVSNFCFWIPCCALVYCLPLPLQLPLFLLATTIWGILLVSIAARTARGGAALPPEETVLPV